MNGPIARQVYSVFAAIFMLASASAFAAPAPTPTPTARPEPTLVLRVFTAPSWCVWCQRQEAFFREQGFNTQIPVRVGNKTHNVRIQLVDTDDDANGELFRSQNIGNGLPTSQLLINGRPVMEGTRQVGVHEGALLNRENTLSYLTTGLKAGNVIPRSAAASTIVLGGPTNQAPAGANPRVSQGQAGGTGPVPGGTPTPAPTSTSTPAN